MTVNIISKEEESNQLSNSFLAWQHIKAKYSNAIILVRHDNEYYTFGSDAEVLSVMLGIEPERGDESRITWHVPHYATDWLLPKLVKAGYRVALCEPLYFKLKGVS
ncbi:hypothetical protein FC093_06370 [Ilyomonas limi]|uniref:DNA mismatch repair protein MutS-like N-terminal domain-containing protein n=1 Tax=Ilyomonas limi TaxID=2575867 RepID=A0A4U3L5D2_9BACT|nr:hypothetical protein [Ilyomonas limi]TKK70368.1 hypothetical protein FC093_06370 [Ilyomonas limi]